MRRFKVTPAFVVAVIALVAAMAGTAFAAGQLVTIVDPGTNQGAKVDATGALKTSAIVTGTVKTTAYPSFDTSTPLPNFFPSSTTPTVLKTTATLAITRAR